MSGRTPRPLLVPGQVMGPSMWTMENPLAVLTPLLGLANTPIPILRDP